MIGVIILCVIVMLVMTVAIIHDKKENGDIRELFLIETHKSFSEESLYSRFKAKIEMLEARSCSVFLFKGLEFKVVWGNLHCKELSFGYNVPAVMVSANNHVSIFKEPHEHKIFEDYIDKEDWKVCFVEDFIKEAEIQIPFSDQLRRILRPLTASGNWVEIGDCEYFTDGYYYVLRFSDWKSLYDKEALDAIEGKEIKRCTNPKKTYWKHFLELEMKAKKQREVECAEFINTILSKQQEYNDLQYKYEMLPSAPITDYESFCNFCKLVNETVIFQDYEITNMLLLKRNEQILKGEVK